MSGDLLKCRSEIRIADMINSDLEIHAIRALGMVENQTTVEPAIVKRHMRDSAFTKRNSPGYDTVLDGWCHERTGRRNHHLDVRARSEERRAHPVLIRLVLKQDPLAHTSLAVVVTGAESRVIS